MFQNSRRVEGVEARRTLGHTPRRICFRTLGESKALKLGRALMGAPAQLFQNSRRVEGVEAIAKWNGSTWSALFQNSRRVEGVEAPALSRSRPTTACFRTLGESKALKPVRSSVSTCSTQVSELSASRRR